MARKDKLSREIDQPSTIGFQGTVVDSTIISAPPALNGIPAPFGLTGTSTIVYSAVSPSIGVSLTWTPGLGSSPEFYRVQHSTNNTFPESLTTTNTVATNSAFIDGLNATTQYYFRVASVFRNVMSAWSDTYGLITIGDTTPPTAVAQSSMSWSWPVGDLIIRWTNPTSSNFKDVRVEIWNDSGKSIKYVDTHTNAGQYVFSAAHNKSVAPGGIADPSVYVELTSRSWSNVYATATTFGALSNPTTQPNKPAPATPTGVVTDFTGPSLVLTWTAVTGALDYILTLDSVDYVANTNKFDYSFGLNKAQHGGTADPSITYQIKSRDGLEQVSAPTGSATATNLPPSAVTGIHASWEGDVGYADEDLTMRWDNTIPPDFDHYSLTITKTDNTVAYVINVLDNNHIFAFLTNKTHFGTQQAAVKVSIVVYDVFGQGSTTYTETLTNAAPPMPTLAILAGFTAIYGQVSNSQTILDLDHYHYTLRLGGTSGATDGTVIEEFDDIIETPILNIDTVGNYKLSAQTFDKFNQGSAVATSALVFIDALTITQLRAEGQYSNSISTDFTSDPTGKANNLLLKDNAIGAGITYTGGTSGNLGKTAIGGSTQDLAADQKRVTTFTLANAAVINKLQVYCSGAGAGAGSQVMRGIIYSNSSGPANLLAQSTEVTVTDGQAAGWVDLPLTQSILLNSGTYWLGVHGGSNTNTIRLYRDSSSNSGRTATDTYSDGTAATFGTATTVSQDISIYAPYTQSVWRWTLFERPLNKIYNRIVVKTANGNPVVAFETRFLNSDGSFTYRYFACVQSDGYTLIEYSNLTLAQAAAIGTNAYIYGWAELPVEVEARYVYMWHNGAFRLDEYYPRTMIRSDDIEAESIRAINIAASAIVADKIAAGAITAVKLSVGIGGGNLIRNGGYLLDNDNNGLADLWFSAASLGSGITHSLYANPYVGSKGQATVNTNVSAQLFGVYAGVSIGIKPGNKYTASFNYMTDTGITTGALMQLVWYDVSNNLLAIDTSPTYAIPALSTYYRQTFTTTAPTNATQVQVHLLANGTTGQRIVFAGAQLEEGDVPTAFKPGYTGNVQIDGEGIMVGVYNGARTVIQQGGLFGFNSSNVEQIRIDSTNGELRAGISGAQRVIINSAGLASYNSGNVLQASIQSSDGKLTAGGGNVLLDSTGLSIKPQTLGIATLDNPRSLRFDTGSTVLGRIALSSNAGVYMQISAGNEATGAGANVIELKASTSNDGVVGAVTSRVYLDNSYVYLDHSILITLNGIINVDTTKVGIGASPVSNTRTTINGFGTTNGTAPLTVRNGSSQNIFYGLDDRTSHVFSAWNVFSDVNVKEKIKDLDRGLSFIKQLKPKKFDYIDGPKDQIGFIAQDVQEFAPELVTTGLDGILSIPMTNFIPILAAAITELDSRIDILEKKGTAQGR